MSYQKVFVPIVLLVIVSLILATGMNISTGMAKADPTKVTLPDQVQPPVDETVIPNCPLPLDFTSNDLEGINRVVDPCDPDPTEVPPTLPPTASSLSGPIDMLDYFLPDAAYTINTTDQYTKYSTIRQTVNGRPGFVIMKNDVFSSGAWWELQNVETFSYDDNFIYLHRDSSWAHSGVDYHCPSTGDEAGHIRLNGQYGPEQWPAGDNGIAKQVWSQYSSQEGGIWVPRQMYYRSVTYSYPITVLGFSEANCKVCGVDAGGPGRTWQKIRIIELKPMSQYSWGSSVASNFGDPEVLELEILEGGAGAGEHFYYTKRFGQVGWSQGGNGYFPTSYSSGNLTLKHDCFSGNCSTTFFDPPSNGWKLTIYNNKNLLGSPVAIRFHPAEEFSFDWADGPCSSCVNADNFSVRFERQANFLVAGRYTFRTTTDDGVRLWVDNELLIDQWRDMSLTEYAGVKDMTMGPHTIRMEYYENGGGAIAKLDVSLGSPPPQSGIHPLRIKAFTGGVYDGLWITRCLGDGTQRVWRVGSDLNWASYQYTENVPSGKHCGTPVKDINGNDIYPVVFRTSVVTPPGAWVTQCRSNHPGEQFAFRVNTSNTIDSGSYANFQYYENNTSCP